MVMSGVGMLILIVVVIVIIVSGSSHETTDKVANDTTGRIIISPGYNKFDTNSQVFIHLLLRLSHCIDDYTLHAPFPRPSHGDKHTANFFAWNTGSNKKCNSK